MSIRILPGRVVEVDDASELAGALRALDEVAPKKQRGTNGVGTNGHGPTTEEELIELLPIIEGGVTFKKVTALQKRIGGIAKDIDKRKFRSLLVSKRNDALASV